MSVDSIKKLKANVRVTQFLSKEELKNVDEAFKYSLETECMELDPSKEKKLVRKIDFFILPVMCILMSCQLMDKSTNSYASIVGLRTDLNMTSQEYSWVGSSFYLGYLVFEYPANMLLQRFPLSKTLALAVVCWGVIICCHGGCQSPASFLLCRTLLGVFEAFMDPAYMIMTSQWYRKEEQYIRCGIWLGLQGFGTMLGSGIAYGFYKYESSYSFAPWRLLFIVTGVITIFFGLVSFIHVPDIPTKAWFLNEEEKKYAVERIRKNKTGFGSKIYKPKQVKEALADPCNYLFFFYMCGYGITNGSLGNFGSILLNEEFEFPTGQALLLNMVGSGVDIVFPVFFAYVNKVLIPSRLATSFLINSIIYIGICLIAFAPQKGAKLTGYFVTFLTTASWACMSSIVSSNVAGHTKKITVNTTFLIGFCVGNIIGPQAFIGSEAPIYITAKRVMTGTYTLTVVSAGSLLIIYYLRNKKKDQLQDKSSFEDNSYLSFGDQTDQENPSFRYIL
ncbi:uncharacterized protein PRCAT00005043001 [Priceomyces carsonii]|uniref:uncharacterized protein n=1 Tax=Priceomyces carsonii TaxID=28549 RepID=UPI002ED92224|nr:unnamed protein product [Priceomyces carsonii]